MKKVCFIGCSFTVGEGFPIDQRDTYIYDRILQRKFNFHRTNLAIGGASNHMIFMTAANALLSDYDVIFVQWSALNRIWLHPGPDTKFFTSARKENSYSYRGFHMSHKEYREFSDLILFLNHDYKNIFDLVDYCSILSRLAEYHHKTIVYINGLVPWENDLLITCVSDIEKDLSSYTKSILDFDTRSDEETIAFFKSLSTKFLDLDRTKWVNLFDSFEKISVDDGPEGHHPGIKSHQIMAEKIQQYIIDNSIFAS